MSLEDPAGVPIRGKMYRRNGEWHMLIHGPSWAVSDFAMEARVAGAKVYSWGGSSGSEEGNVLIGSKGESAQEWDPEEQVHAVGRTNSP